MTTKRKPSLRWSLQPRVTGLAAVCASPRGHVLKYGGEVVAGISPWTPGGFSSEYRGWYWYTPSNDDLGIRFTNTYSPTGPDWDDGELDKAKAFVRARVAERIAAGVKP